MRGMFGYSVNCEVSLLSLYCDSTVSFCNSTFIDIIDFVSHLVTNIAKKQLEIKKMLIDEPEMQPAWWTVKH